MSLLGICGRGREEGKHKGEGRAEVDVMVSTKAGRRVDVCAVVQSVHTRARRARVGMRHAVEARGWLLLTAYRLCR